MNVIFRQIICIVVVALSLRADATTLIPRQFERQLQDADAVIVGRYIGSHYKRLATGEIMTEASFQIDGHVGISINDIYHPGNFKVLYPGGQWRGQIVSISLAPSFKEGEEVVLLLEKRNFGYLIQNLSLGKYQIVQKNALDKSLSSSAFPEHHELGKISWDKFEGHIKHRFGSGLTRANEKKTVHFKKPIDKEQISRKPSSIRENASIKENKTLWIVLLFIGLGALSTYRIKRGRWF